MILPHLSRPVQTCPDRSVWAVASGPQRLDRTLVHIEEHRSLLVLSL